MARVDLEYWLPSLVVLQQAPMEPINFRVDDLVITIHERSIRGGWLGNGETARTDDAGNYDERASGSTTAPIIPTGLWLSEEKWRRIGSRLASGEELEPYDELLLESTASRVMGNLRSSVLACAMACEIALKRFFVDVGGRKVPLYPFAVDRFNVPQQLDNVLPCLTGEHLRDRLRLRLGDPKTGRLIGRQELGHLFEARNKVAHEGRAYYREG